MAQITGDGAPYGVGAAAAATTTDATVLPSAGAGVGDAPGTRRANWTPYLFLGLPLVLYCLWVIGPMFFTFYMGLTETDGITFSTWVGLDNYERLWNDRVFWIAFWNNVKWLVAYICIPTVLGLGLALLLNNSLPGTRFFKAGFFSPMVLSGVVIANVWGWMYFPTDGLINSTLALFGYDGKPIGWLSDFSSLPKDGPLQLRSARTFDLVNVSIIIAGIWRQIGYVMLLYLAGLKNVDPSLVDASKTDGASSFQSFRDIVLPQLQPVTVIVVVISIIDALRAFDLVNLMTRGGPSNRSEVLANMMYIEAFNNYNMGYGAAIASILGAMSMLFIFPYLRHMVKNEMEY